MRRSVRPAATAVAVTLVAATVVAVAWVAVTAGRTEGIAEPEHQGDSVASSSDPSAATFASAAPWDSEVTVVSSGTFVLQDGAVPAAVNVDLSSARTAREGHDYELVYDTRPGGSGWVYGQLDIMESGLLFATGSAVDDYDGGPWLLSSSSVGTMDGTTFTEWPSSEAVLADAHPRQTYAASVEGATAVWAETASLELGISNWRIFAGSGDTPWLIARSEDVYEGNLPIVDGDATPVLSGGRVYWATTVPWGRQDSTTFGVQVMSRAVDASDAAVVEVVGAGQPAIGSDGLYVAATSRDDPSIPVGAIMIKHVDGGGVASPVLTYTGPEDSSVQSLVADGERLAFAIGHQGEGGGQIVVLDVETSAITVIPLLASGRGESVEMCGDRLVWTSANGSIDVPDSASIGVLNLATGDLARLVVPDNFAGVRCEGDLMLWRTLEMTTGATGVPTVVRWSAR